MHTDDRTDMAHQHFPDIAMLFYALNQLLGLLKGSAVADRHVMHGLGQVPLNCLEETFN